MSAVFFDPVFLAHETGRHPECPERLEAILEALEASPAFPGEGPRRCPAVGREALYRVHDPAYVQHVEWMSARGGGPLDGDTVLSAGSNEAALRAAGAAVAAAEGVWRGEFPSAFCAVRPPGHHALPARGMGFCVFNNVAVAARHATEALGARRVLIVDWDVHHGNGTQAVFETDPDVFYLSVHRHPHYPGTGLVSERGSGPGEGATLNTVLGPGAGEDEFLRALGAALAAARDFRPEMVFVSCGFDAVAGDALGGLSLQPGTYRLATERVREFARGCGHERIVSVLEGGYLLGALGECAREHFEALP